MSNATQAQIDTWLAEPRNTARSVLATIFGDTIAPVGGEIWLSQLFELTGVFAFTPRLVRTSLYRLASEGWCANQRIGRQSKYSLTESAAKDTEDAEQRIYHRASPDWSGEWTAAFLDSPSLSGDTQRRVEQRLRWLGFHQLSPTMLASPTVDLGKARRACERAAAGVVVPLARVEFSDLDDLVQTGFFVEALSMVDREKSYREFISFYERVDANTVKDPRQSLAVRTMLVHDLRRIRLSGPDIPTQLLPEDWPGAKAFALAGELYPTLSATASPWLSTALGIEYPSEFPKRF